MSRSRGKRYDAEPKLNVKKVVATIIAIIVFIMFVLSLKNLFTKENKPKEVVSVTTYFSSFKDGKWGVIDNKGNEIIKAESNEMITIPDKTRDIFIVVENQDYTANTYSTKVLNKSGEEIFTEYNQVEAIQNELNSEVWYEDDVLTYVENGKYGIINFDGKKITEAIYDSIYALSGVEKSIIIEKDGKLGLVNSTTNQVVLEAEYTEISSLQNNNYASGYIVKGENGKYGIVDANKKQILDFNYDDIEHVSGNNLYVVKENKKLEVVNKDGTVVLDSGFDDIVAINGESIIIEKDGKNAVINTAGEEIIPAEYDSLAICFDKNYIAKKDDKYGIITSSNEIAVDFTYTGMNYRSEANFVEAEKENYKTDIIDSNFNKVLQDVIISEVNNEKGYLRVRIEDNYKYYNFKFEEKASSDLLTANTLFLVKENGKYGYKNKDGNLVVDCIYDDAKEQNEYGYCAVKKDGVWGALAYDGTVIVTPSVNLDNNLYIDFINDWHLFEDVTLNTYTK
jgi:hypothetical protein